MTFLATLVLLQRPDITLANFEQADYGEWTVGGTAFGASPAQGTLPNQMNVRGFRGKGLANSYVNGDDSIGSLTSPEFKVQRKFINFLIGGGKKPGEACINLVVNGKVELSATGRSTIPQDTEALRWTTWDVSKWQGKNAVIEILDNAKGGWGHINVDEITQSDSKKEVPPRKAKLYDEDYRPQFHFSAQKNWLNDPNGLVFFEGEYHLFYQHNPFGTQWGNMTWGHAVSPDLVHWKELPVAIKPTERGTIYSGSAAVDTNNTTGFGAGKKPPLVAMYTLAGKPFTQDLAYSNDQGRTWKQYQGNPVIGHIAGENRDPRIFWHPESNKWVMALYLDGDEFAIYNSPDLKKWTELSRLHLPGSSECPDLFPINYYPSGADKAPTRKWIFFGGNFRYLIGQFDGTKFTSEEGPYVGDFGPNFYASQTYNNTPDGRRIIVGWMNGNGPFAEMPFNQQMSFPREMRLVDSHDGMRLSQAPVREINKLRKRMVEKHYIDAKEVNKVLGSLKGDLYDIQAEFSITSPEPFTIQIRGIDVVVDPGKFFIECQGRKAPLINRAGVVDVRILVDRSCLEIFAENGITVLSTYIEPELDLHKVVLIGNPKVNFLRATELKSAW
jgi:fructan beta-fructosidase